jgi:Predicted transcriptional regulators
MISPFLQLNTSQALYQQIVDYIIHQIESGRLKKDDDIPSINVLAQSNKISRDTVMMAYNELKQNGIIKAIPGKGYYIRSTNTNRQKNIFLLFDELNAFKEDLYQAFMVNLPSHFKVDLYFHHFNKKVFNQLIADNAQSYHKYIIMPSNMPQTGASIDILPPEKVILLDQAADHAAHSYPIIYQSFADDIYNGLLQASEKIKRYNQLILLFPGGKEPIGFKEGFIRFCIDHNLKYQVQTALNPGTLQIGNLYLCIDNRDLIELVKQIREKGYHTGEQIGLISINDTALHEIIEGGITSISTDFKEMGRRLAQMVTHNESSRIKNPSRLIERHSL